MSDNEITITVDGKPLTATKGQMLIEVTDAAGVDIPRFCYHKKLSVAANCRMCLVEVEKAPKPLPACATPVMPDMIVKTKSPLALAAQQSTMEFLLINHPLDCPICDQGGECELQDVAMGYGGSVSQYTEGKRVVMDKYIGPLIATEMTRCIHCTRCVRFGEEIAGIRELGATGRGEDVRIGTYIEKSVASEVSGNVIDVCPVGALTARPSRYSARAWELTQAPSIAVHDSIGSNLYVHLNGDKVNRVVPRENESVNEVWISDRDRFSYQGISNEDRIRTPLVRVDGKLKETDWQTALHAAADALKTAENSNFGVLASASATLEELYLLQKLARALGCNNIDHRLSQTDFSCDESAPVMPWLGMQVAGLENLSAALLVGSNIRKDQPIAALRLRKAALNGAPVSFINPKAFPLHFEAAENLICRGDQMVQELLAVAMACNADLSTLDNLPKDIDVKDSHRNIASALQEGENSALFLGNIAVQHPLWHALRLIAIAIARATGGTLSLLPERANTCGAWLAGVVPHRKSGGHASKADGLNAAQMLAEPMDVYLGLGVEVEFDAALPSQACASLAAAKEYISVSSFMSESIANSATVVLPMAAFTETYGTYVNAAGLWQSAKGVVSPEGDARPAWKILRVVGDILDLEGFDFSSPEQITRELQVFCESVELNNLTDSGAACSLPQSTVLDSAAGELMRNGEIPLYAIDPLVRRSQALQKTEDAKAQAFVSVSGAQADQLKLSEGDAVALTQYWSTRNGDGQGETVMPLHIDDGVPDGCVWLAAGIEQTMALGALYTPIIVSKSATKTEHKN